MVTETPQRAYRAACPGCGAPVAFLSAQSTHAVCGYCRSTVVRQGDKLARLGKMAELAQDFSLLQLGATGRIDNRAFTLVGRLQYRYSEGLWTEWQAVFDDGQPGTLAEDNGAYVFTRPTTTQRELPASSQFRVGATTAINGKTFVVSFNESVSLVAAQGELSRLPPLNQPFDVVELRSQDAAGGGEVLSIEYAGQPPLMSLGRAVLIDELAMSGLRSESASEDQGRQFSCPNCGAPVTVNLAGSKSITCGACRSIIDLSAGIGGELSHAAQDEPIKPLIPLGSLGQLQGVRWQVVGFQHRMGQAPDDDEQFGWSEYLLYNAKRGFTFLVDAEDGWSIVKPTTGAPKWTKGANTASYLGTTYTLQYSYEATTNYAAGEFYWQVRRGQKTFNRDFAAGKHLLSMEETPREVTWSSGSRVDAGLVAKAFGLQDKIDQLKRADAKPVSVSRGAGCLSVMMIFTVILVIILLLAQCSDEESSGGSGYRSAGGSYGGISAGGGHK